jgi:RNA polymerase sigma-70 factor (ECF subfamily)
MITPLKDYFSKDDNSLVRRARKGDIGAFEELVARHRDKLFTRAFSILRNVEEAINITQKAWVEGWQWLPRFAGDSSFGAWMMRVVIGLCVDQIRKEKPRRARCCKESDEDGIGGNHQVRIVTSNPSVRREPAELTQRMDQALGQLSPENRTVLVLHELEKMEYKEIARIMSCSIGEVTSKLLYARRKIAALLDN